MAPYWRTQGRAAVLPVLVVALFLPAVAAAAAESRKVDFRGEVAPIFREHCFACHAGDKPESGRRLDDRGELLGESDGRPLIVPGRSGESRLIQLVTAQDKERMPPPGEGRPLTAPEVAVLSAWIDQGAAWDEELFPRPVVRSDHWAFQTVVRPPLPSASAAGEAETPVDWFVQAEWAARGLRPAPRADRRTLIRRVTLDLTGLPPTPEEVDAFLADDRPDAYEQLVERLLASPAYGERWGRHWLDVARYADTEGYESNHPRPFAWRYRDWVVAALNADLPYDEFVRRQVAGDELAPPRDENLIATGFLAAARLSSNEEDKVLQRHQVLVDVTNAVGSSLLGLTIGCAQCHNHKFDPISQRDYYRLYGLFVRGQPGNLVLRDPTLWQDYLAAVPADYEPAVALRQAIYDRARGRVVERRRAELSPAARAALDLPPPHRSPAEAELARQAELRLQLLPGEVEPAIEGSDRQIYDLLKKKIDEQEKRLPPKPQTWGYYAPGDAASPVDLVPMKGFYPLPFEPDELAAARSRIFVRGETTRPGPIVPAGWPAVLGAAPEEGPPARPRTALADWLTRREHPLTARVWVNRLWQFHFGRGLVATPNDFGQAGARPTHPLLLDWLAAELMDHGWSTKHLQRAIVLSATYRRATAVDAATRAADPENHGLARFPLRRLEAEAIRDAMLVAAGLLDPALGGAPVAAADMARSRRRTLYFTNRRDDFAPLLALFDAPAANESCARRETTLVPLQALHLLNHEAYQRLAEALAHRVRREAGADRGSQIRRAFALTLAREPTLREVEHAAAFFAAAPAAAPPEGADLPLADFCQALLNLNEFVYLP